MISDRKKKNKSTLFTGSVGPDEKNCALGLENDVPRYSSSGRFQDLGHSSKGAVPS
jgi:hypothetical protein